MPTKEELRKQIIYQPGLDKESCDFIIRGYEENTLASRNEGGLLDIGGERTFHNKEIRDVITIYDSLYQDGVDYAVKRAIKTVLEPFYRTIMGEYEKPQYLIYKSGGKYLPHIDGEYTTDNVNWLPVNDRKYTLLFYLNEDYNGGTIDFPDLDLSYKPPTGYLLAFPSNRHYKHGAREVVAGVRRVLVTWIKTMF